MKKTAQIDIKLTGLNTIQDLENELNDVNKQLKQVDVNSQEFKTLSQRASDAKSKLSTINGELNGITSQQKTDSIKKLGEGLVGAFQVGAGASLIFGEQTTEELQKIISKVAGLYAAMDGIDKVSKAFSADNIANLKEVGKGFGTLVRTVKTASLSMKTALITTGVGALVVGVGLLIANWDKLTASIANSKRSKFLEGEKVRLEKQVEFTKERLSVINNTIDKEKELFQLENRGAELYAFEEEKLTKLLETQQEQIDLLNIDLELQGKINTEEGKRLKSRIITMNGLRDALAKQKESLKQMELIPLKIEEINAEIALMNKQLEIAQSLMKFEVEIDNLKNQENYLNNNLIILGSQKFVSDKIYKISSDLIKNRINEIKLNKEIYGQLTKQEKLELTTLAAQQQALFIQNQERKEMLGIDIQSLEIEISKNKIADNYNTTIALSNIKEREQIKIAEEKKVISESNLELINLDIEGYYKAIELRKNMVNFDRQSNRIIKERTTNLLPSQLKITNEINNKINDFVKVFADSMNFEDANFFADTVKQFSDEYIDLLSTTKDVNLEYGKQTNYGKQLISDASSILAIKRVEKDMNEKTLNAQLKSLIEQKNVTDKLSQKYSDYTFEIEKQLEFANKTLVYQRDRLKSLEEEGGREEEIYAVLQLINKAENDRTGLVQELFGITQTVNESQTKSKVISDEILQTQYKITSNETDYKNSVTETTNKLQDQLRVYAQIQQFTQQYAEEINAAQQLVGQSFGLVAALFDRQAANATKKLNKLQKQLSKLEKSEDNLKELKDELKDADGERYDNLIDLIAQEEAAELNKNANIDAQRIAIEEEIAKQEKIKADAEYKAAKWRKAQAIIDATIQGVLSVVEALPNVVLAAIVGAMSAASIATIASQALPPKAEDGMLVGKSHAQGGIHIEAEHGEYIVNKKATSQYLPLIEAINSTGVKKFADGGQVAPTSSSSGSGDIIDYGRLAFEISRSIQPVVSVVDITRGQQKVAVIEKNAKF